MASSSSSSSVPQWTYHHGPELRSDRPLQALTVGGNAETAPDEPAQGGGADDTGVRHEPGDMLARRLSKAAHRHFGSFTPAPRRKRQQQQQAHSTSSHSPSLRPSAPNTATGLDSSALPESAVVVAPRKARVLRPRGTALAAAGSAAEAASPSPSRPSSVGASSGHVSPVPSTALSDTSTTTTTPPKAAAASPASSSSSAMAPPPNYVALGAYVRPLDTALVERMKQRVDLLPPTVEPHPLSARAHTAAPPTTGGLSLLRYLDGVHAEDALDDDDASMAALPHLLPGRSTATQNHQRGAFLQSGIQALVSSNNHAAGHAAAAPSASASVASDSLTQMKRLARQLRSAHTSHVMLSADLDSSLAMSRADERGVGGGSGPADDAFVGGASPRGVVPDSLRLIAQGGNGAMHASFESTTGPLLELLAPHVASTLASLSVASRKRRDQLAAAKPWKVAPAFARNSNRVVGEMGDEARQLARRREEEARAIAAAMEAVRVTANTKEEEGSTTEGQEQKINDNDAALRDAAADAAALSPSSPLSPRPPSSERPPSRPSLRLGDRDRSWSTRGPHLVSHRDSHRVPYQSVSTAVERDRGKQQRPGSQMPREPPTTQPQPTRGEDEQEGSDPSAPPSSRRPAVAASSIPSPSLVHSAFLVDDVRSGALLRAGLIQLEEALPLDLALPHTYIAPASGATKLGGRERERAPGSGLDGWSVRTSASQPSPPAPRRDASPEPATLQVLPFPSRSGLSRTVAGEPSRSRSRSRSRMRSPGAETELRASKFIQRHLSPRRKPRVDEATTTKSNSDPSTAPPPSSAPTSALPSTGAALSSSVAASTSLHRSHFRNASSARSRDISPTHRSPSREKLVAEWAAATRKEEEEEEGGSYQRSEVASVHAAGAPTHAVSMFVAPSSSVGTVVAPVRGSSVPMHPPSTLVITAPARPPPHHAPSFLSNLIDEILPELQAAASYQPYAAHPTSYPAALHLDDGEKGPLISVLAPPQSAPCTDESQATPDLAEGEIAVASSANSGDSTGMQHSEQGGEEAIANATTRNAETSEHESESYQQVVAAIAALTSDAPLPPPTPPFHSDTLSDIVSENSSAASSATSSPQLRHRRQTSQNIARRRGGRDTETASPATAAASSPHTPVVSSSRTRTVQFASPPPPPLTLTLSVTPPTASVAPPPSLISPTRAATALDAAKKFSHFHQLASGVETNLLTLPKGKEGATGGSGGPSASLGGGGRLSTIDALRARRSATQEFRKLTLSLNLSSIIAAAHESDSLVVDLASEAEKLLFREQLQTGVSERRATISAQAMQNMMSMAALKLRGAANGPAGMDTQQQPQQHTQHHSTHEEHSPPPLEDDVRPSHRPAATPIASSSPPTIPSMSPSPLPRYAHAIITPFTKSRLVDLLAGQQRPTPRHQGSQSARTAQGDRAAQRYSDANAALFPRAVVSVDELMRPRALTARGPARAARQRRREEGVLPPIDGASVHDAKENGESPADGLLSEAAFSSQLATHPRDMLLLRHLVGEVQFARQEASTLQGAQQLLKRRMIARLEAKLAAQVGRMRSQTDALIQVAGLSLRPRTSGDSRTQLHPISPSSALLRADLQYLCDVEQHILPRGPGS